jgi:hypothetical protein
MLLGHHGEYPDAVSRFMRRFTQFGDLLAGGYALLTIIARGVAVEVLQDLVRMGVSQNLRPKANKNHASADHGCEAEIHRAAALLRASFRPRLATTPLRFANPSPPSGWMEDFHLQAVDHARHTERTPRQGTGQVRHPPREMHPTSTRRGLIRLRGGQSKNSRMGT